MATLLLLAVGLAGCDAEPERSVKIRNDEIKLYVIEAATGVFEPTGHDNVYKLKTQGLSENVTWFNARPLRGVGLESVAEFMQADWNFYFTGYDPSASIAMRSASGAWRVLPAKIVDTAYEPQSNTLTWTVRLASSPDAETMSAVIVYLDNEGASQESAAHVVTQPAAQARFEPVPGSDAWSLKLLDPAEQLSVMPVSADAQADRVDNEQFVNSLWVESFFEVQPNAAVTMVASDGRLFTRVVTLSEPRWDAANRLFTYQAKPLAGELPAFSGPAVVYMR